jgi:DNA-binding transcriptional MerR regulator
MLTSDQVCDLAGISFRQLNYWASQGYLSPAPRANPGSGHRRRWTPLQAYKAVALAGMLRDGITHDKAVELIRAGRAARLVSRPLREAIIDDLPPAVGPDVVVRSRS